ncbi:type I toxin-antitoxin system SymE family toxin [Salmonella enterica subsp. enterica]|nr:type I toxin-antitoxin system SymE family toxin [Salmonella enterica subsp. enterica]
MRLRVAADDPRQLPLRVPLQLLVAPRGQLAPLVIAVTVTTTARQPVVHHRPAPGASSCSRCRHTQTRADIVPDFTHCEFYSRIEGRSVRLCGDWMSQAGFINGMPVKIRVMKDCIMITPQNTREL